MKQYLTQKQTDIIFDRITANECREMDKTRFNQAVNEAVNEALHIHNDKAFTNKYVRIMTETKLRLKAVELLTKHEISPHSTVKINEVIELLVEFGNKLVNACQPDDIVPDNPECGLPHFDCVFNHSGWCVFPVDCEHRS